MKLLFHGVRGSLPVPSAEFTRYGGNTTCLEFRPSSGESLIIDAGTGIRSLGKTLGKKGKCSILLTHEHWDHIFGLPFFAPLYEPGWEISLYVPCGSAGVLQRMMDGIAFPVHAVNLPAVINLHEYRPGEVFSIGDIKVSTFAMPHPGGCTGLRCTADDWTVAVSGDCEILPQTPQVAETLHNLLLGADTAVVDGQYALDQYERFRGWGHSPREAWLAPAEAAKIKQLYFTHHDVDSTDDLLDEWLDQFTMNLSPLSLQVNLAYEGSVVDGGTSNV